MNIPGFTAETSLYKTSGHYRAMAGTPNALVGGLGVLPQLKIPLFECQADCAFSPDYNACIWQCFWDAPVGGGGGDPPPGGGCVQGYTMCKRDLVSPNSCFKYFRNSDCDLSGPFKCPCPPPPPPCTCMRVRCCSGQCTAISPPGPCFSVPPNID